MLLNSETNTCETIQARMTALVDNELSQADIVSTRSHIAGCLVCTQSFEQIQQTLKTTDAWTVEGTDIWESVESRLSSEPKPAVNSLPQNVNRLPELLGTKHVISAEQFAEVLYIHKRDGGDLGRIIVDLGYAAERDVIESKAQAEGLPFIDLTKHKPEPSAVNVVPAHVARRHKALPVKKDGTKLWVAMMDPRNVVALDEIRMVSRCQVAPLAAVLADLEQALVKTYPTEMPVEPAHPDSDRQGDLQAVLTEMRALRSEIQELRGEVGTLRRLLSVTQQTPMKPSHPLSPPQMMPLALPENAGLGLL